MVELFILTLPSVVMSLGSCFYITLYYIVTCCDSTVFYCLAEYTTIDNYNLRFGMVAQFNTA